MIVWPSKGPTETADFDIDWSLRLGSDTIQTSSWSIIGVDDGQQAPPSLQILGSPAPSFTSTATKVWLSGGTAGVVYILANTVTTVAGDTLVVSVELPVCTPVTTNNLTTLARAMQWLGVASDDGGYIARIIATISTEIQNFIGFQVEQASYSRSFDGQGTRKFFVPDIPLVSVQSLTIDGVAIPQGQPGTYQSGFYWNNQSINLIGYSFSRGFQNVQSSYTSGYQTVPADIEQACLDWTKNVYISGKQVDVPSNVVRVAAGDTSFDFGGSGAVTDTKKLPMPSAIYAVLQSYRRVAQISGW